MVSESVFISTLGAVLTVAVALISGIWAMMASKVDSIKADSKESIAVIWEQINEQRKTKAEKSEVKEIKTDIKDMREHMNLMAQSMAEISQNMSHIADAITEIKRRDS